MNIEACQIERKDLQESFLPDEEEEIPKRKPEKAIKKSLQELDRQIDREESEVQEWSDLIHRSFHDPNHPTLVEAVNKCRETLKEMDSHREEIVFFYQTAKMRILLRRLFEILEDLTKQLDMLFEIIQPESDLKEISQKYQQLGQLILPIDNHSQICYKILSTCLEYLLNNLLFELQKTLDHLFQKRGTIGHEAKVIELQIMIGKIKTISDYIPVAAVFDKKDIFALDDNDPYLKELQQKVRFRVLGPSQKIKKSFKKFVRSIQIGMSAVSKSSDFHNEIAKKLTLSFGAMYYYLAPHQAQRQTNLFYSEPNDRIAWEVWNFFEDELMANVMKISLPAIQYARKIYINRTFEKAPLELFTKAVQDQTLNTLAPLEFKPDIHKEKHEEVTTLNIKAKNKKKAKQNKERDIKIKGFDKIPILILSNKRIAIKRRIELDILPKDSRECHLPQQIVGEKFLSKPSHQQKQKSYCGLGFLRDCFGISLSEIEDPASYFQDVVMHFHGGGFVAMSSRSHQSYTRKWSKILKKPVLSVDYRLAPDHPYPAGLDDCWQAYNWVLKYAEEILGIKPTKIILTGDSAGGNLAIGVTVLAIKTGIRIPDGLLLAYPALRLDPRVFTPSLLLALDDQLVPYSLLRLCVEAYVPSEVDPSLDPLLSPINLADEILAKLPPIRIMVGDNDPLHDDCWRFTDRLRKLGKDVALSVYKDMCHGFLGYDIPMGMSESKVCISDAADLIAELLHGPEEVSVRMEN